jgi:hypothetical protein
MHVKQKKRTPPATKVRLQESRNGKRTSFRDLKAFGLWKRRNDLKDTVQFTRQLRSRMEQGHDAG